MRIGFDAKWLASGPPSGRRVVAGLLRHLQSEAGSDDVHVFLDDRARRTDDDSSVDADRRHFVWARNNQLANLFVVPRRADQLRLDAVVYQNFAPPRALARHRRIAFVYDAIAETRPRDFRWRERLYLAPLRTLAAQADRVCTISLAERQRLTALRYAAPNRIDVVSLGVDPQFVPREALDPARVETILAEYDLAGRFVLYAGRVNARKNVETLVRAFARVPEPTLTLVIAGDADGTAVPLPALAESLGIAARVRILEHVDDETLRTLYASAALYVYPSLDEGFGLCPLEAMAAGTPALVSDIPVLREVCGDAAQFVDSRDADALAQAIAALMGDEALRGTLGARGRARAGSYTWSAAARSLLAAVHRSMEHPA